MRRQTRKYGGHKRHVCAAAEAIRQRERDYPTSVRGDIEITNVTFAYPSRPTVPVLKDVSIYLAAQDTTFIVGSSGSGKSTIAHLLQRLYQVPQGSGMFSLDDQDLAYCDEAWSRDHISSVSQTCILFDMTVHDDSWDD